MPPSCLCRIMLLASILLLSCPPRLLAKDSILWLEAVMPPYLIQDGDFKEQGYGDMITHIIQQQLTGYDHEEMVTNIARHFYKFKQGEKVCSVGLFKTPERAEFMYFSIPSFLTLPAVVIIRKDKLPAFGNRSTVKLEELFSSNTMIFGLSKDRSYGIDIDTIIKKHAGQQSIFEFTGPELSHNLFKMLMKGRLDGLIGLPEEVLYQAEQLGLRDQLVTLSIEENMHGYDGWLSAVGCSKNEWGREVIGKINAILLAARPASAYREAYERWLDDNSKGHYRKVYADVFLKAVQ